VDEEGQRIARANVERRKAGVTEAHDFLFRRKDGTALWTRVQTNPLVDKANQYAGALAMISDATESRAAEHALRSSEERFRALIEHSSDVTILFDAEGTTTFVSPSYTTAMGFQPEEIVGTRARDLVHPDDRAVVMAARLRLLQTPGAVDRVVMRTRHRDGHWRTFEAINRNLLHLPSVAAIVSNLRDITEQRRIEEQYLQAQKLAGIGRLAGGIAHDFNNILTAILGYSELLENEPDRATRVDDLRRIQRAGERARDLTMQLLAFARRQVISPRAVDLSEVVDHSLHLVRRLLGEDVEIDTLLLPGLGSVLVDPAQIEQVLLNLAINARDAMPSGGRLTIQTAGVVFDAEFAASNPDVVAGPHVMLVVSDTGSGIDAVDLPHIFEPFYTTKPVGQGTGLGLATSYGIVKQSGGHVFVSSEPGVGTTFKLCFPRLDVPVAAVASEALVTPPSGGTETILLVEDDFDVSELTSQTLRESGYRVLVAASPAEALRLLDGAGVTFDLMLTDVVMPGMSGRQLAEQVTARFSRMHVLYVSGYAEDTVMRHGVVDTGIEFLAKPFTPTTLRQAVRRLLDQGRATRPGGPSERPV
jgi:two-component system, cell cycle sensor histidine kinase and response regulator CckA